MKKIHTLALSLITASTCFSQSGQKWATGGNSLSNSDFLGSTNNMPLIFKVNNNTQMQLSNSGLKLNSLSGSSNSLLQSDANGNVLLFPMGTSNQYLSGTGTWLNLPAIPAPLWSSSGSNIYYNTGKVGIGTNNPQTALDINGDLTVSNNVYVGGGILISNKIHAPIEIKTTALRADSLFPQTLQLAAGRDVLGDASFAGNLTAKNSLTVQGSANIAGNLRSNYLTVASLAGNATGSPVFVDSLGNLRVIPPPGTGTIQHCTPQLPWMIGGNNLGNITNAVIGPCNNTDFVMQSNNTSYLWLKPNGFFGINNASPNAMLDITASTGNNALNISNSGGSVFSVANNGNTTISTSTVTANPVLTVLGASASSIVSSFQNPQAYGYAYNASTFFTVNAPAAWSYNQLVQAGDNALIFDDGTGGNGQYKGFVIGGWNENGTHGIRLDGATGNVGIGTANPIGALSVLATGTVAVLNLANSNGSVFSVANNGNASMLAGAQLSLKDANHGLGYFDGTTGFAGRPIDGPVLYGYSGGALGINQSGIQALALKWDNNGNVSIPKLASATPQMVIASTAGTLSVQAMPTDNQQLSVIGTAPNQSLAISGGNTVPLSALGDNMGNCAATNDIQMNGFSITQGTATPFDILGVKDITFSNGQGVGINLTTFTGLETSGNFSIDGAATVEQDIAVNGNTTLGGSLTVSGTANVGQDMTVNGNTTLGGNLTISGATTAQGFTCTSMYSSGNVSIDGNLTIDGNQLKLGSVTVDSYGNVNNVWYSSSDIRYKKNIEIITKSLDKILKMRGALYEYDKDNFPKMNFREGKTMGFIAQELKEVLPEAVRQKEDGYYVVNYQAVIPVLVEAIKEQQKIISNVQGNSSKQDSLYRILQQQNNRQDSLIKALAASINACCLNKSINLENSRVAEQDIELSNADIIVLNQNVPNPFAEQTLITYNIPQNTGSAQILFYDMNGRQIKTVDVTKGKGQLNVYANDLTSGAYSYTLIVDGKIIDTKKMIKQ